MEPNDEVVERQKLVPNDVETEEEAKSAQTPATPVAVPKINVSHTPNFHSTHNTQNNRNNTLFIKHTWTIVNCCYLAPWHVDET